MSDITFILANKKQNSSITDSVVGSKYFSDCTINIEHQFDNTVTEHAVERGANFTDHVQQQNNVFVVSGVFSDVPIMAYNGDALPQQQRMKAAYNFLQELRTAGTKFTFVSNLASYPDCVVEKLSIPSDATTFTSLRFDMTIKQIRSAKTESINVVQVSNVAPAKQDDAAPQTNEGKKQSILNPPVFIASSGFYPIAPITDQLRQQNQAATDAANNKAQELLKAVGGTRP